MEEENQKTQEQQPRKVHTREEIIAYKMKKEQEDKKARELERIQKLIVCVCEENIPEFENQINKLVGQLAGYVQKKEEELDQKIIDVFSQSIALIDNKSSIYALVFAKLIIHEEDFSHVQLSIWKKIYISLEKAIQEGNLSQLINISLFLCNAVKLGYYSQTEFLQYLKKLYGMQSDFFCLVLLQVFSFNLNNIKKDEQWTQLFSDVSKFLDQQQQKIQSQLQVLDFYQVNNKEYQTQFQNIFTVFIDRINKRLESEDYTLKGFYNPIDVLFQEQFKESTEDLAKFQQIIKDIRFYEVILKNDKQKLPIYKKIYRKNFSFIKKTQTNEEEKKGGIDAEGEDKEINLKEEENNKIKENFDQSLERILLQIYLQQLIETYNDNKKLLIKRLQSYTCHQFQFLDEIIEKTVIENLFDQALILPTSQFKECTYTSILIGFTQRIEFGKQYVSEYLENILNNNDNIQNIDIEILQRLSKQYALYLSNTNLGLDWEMFAKYTDEQEDFNIQQYFLKLLFKELFLLQTPTKMCSNIPEGLQIFFPSFKQKTDLIRLENNENEKFEFCKEKLDQKTQAEPMLEALQTFKDEEDKDETFKKLFPYFLEALFLKMCPTQTHLNILFNRYKFVFEQAQITLTKEKFGEIVGERILFFWQQSDFHMIKYFNKFGDNDLLNSEQIIASIISKIEEVSSEVEAEETQIRYFNVLKSVNTNNQVEIATKLNDIVQENKDESAVDFSVLEKLFRVYLRANFTILNQQEEGQQIIKTYDSKYYEILQNNSI